MIRLDSFWITVIALGIAGLDPVGALLGISALTAGSKRLFVVLYGAIVMVTTVIVGTVLSLTAASFSITIDWSFPWIPDPVWAVGQFAVGMALLAFGIKRLRSQRSTDDEQPRKHLGSPITLIGVGLLFGITAPTDPTFVGLSYLVGRTESLFAIIAAHSTWILISQLPLTILIIAVAMNKHHAVTRRIQAVWNKVSPVFTHTITGLVSAAGAFLLIEVGWWATSGQWYPFW